jgi:hypothetical protein
MAKLQAVQVTNMLIMLVHQLGQLEFRKSPGLLTSTSCGSSSALESATPSCSNSDAAAEEADFSVDCGPELTQELVPVQRYWVLPNSVQVLCEELFATAKNMAPNRENMCRVRAFQTSRTD